MVQFSQLDDSSLGYRKAELEAVFSPYVIKELSADDPEWKSVISRRKFKIAKRFLRQKLLGKLLKERRVDETIMEEYGVQWSKTEFSNYDPGVDTPPYNYWIWNDRRLVARVRGIARVRLYLIAKAIEALRPKRVLEVGCGNGVNLLALAGMFPEIEFTGLELTKEGIEKAQKIQTEDILPQSLIDFMPLPNKDSAAFKRTVFLQGSAAELPFKDGEFDFVFSAVAVEQMEAIRHQALSEIGRVTGEYALLSEPFYDVNSSGTARLYVVGRDYFRGAIDDLPRYGLEPVWATKDLPNKINFNVCTVLCKKLKAPVEA